MEKKLEHLCPGYAKMNAIFSTTPFVSGITTVLDENDDVTKAISSQIAARVGNEAIAPAIVTSPKRSYLLSDDTVAFKSTYQMKKMKK